ncbi:MAG: anion permease, partial [Deltaproteobacteria bacterium]|nr:anion permease [Deltaproteobacteria bacterium]
PIAINLVEACRLPDRSRGSALICLVAWASALLPGTGWLTGSLWGPFMMGFFPAEVKPLVTFGAWFEYMSVPWLLITLFFVVLIYIFLKPKEELAISKDTFKEQYTALGKMSKHELITGVILTATLIMFTTE